MPFTITADAVFDHFKFTVTKGTPVAIQAQGISQAKYVSYQNVVTTDGQLGSLRPIITELSLWYNQQKLAKVSREEMNNFFKFVGDNSDANYRNVKTNQLWKKVYGVHSKQFDTYDSKTNLKGINLLDATYCQKCGIVLPLRNLTIDHQKPQKGGEVEAMIRVFRAAGLTVATGHGQKNRYLQGGGGVAQSVGGTMAVRARGDKGDIGERYTLNEKGIIYFTMLHHFNLRDQMLQMSMHHIANLRPMCGPCNSALRNTNIIWNFV